MSGTRRGRRGARRVQAAAGLRDVEAILKCDPLLTHTRTHAQLLGTMTENDGYSCRGGTSQV